MTTYTVYRAADTSSHTSGLTLDEAADALLTTDGYAYEWRTDDEGYHVLWISDGSANSTRGARHMRPTVFAGFDRAAVLHRIVCDEWRGYEATTDERFAEVTALDNDDA
jgi:hypothetical protein